MIERIDITSTAQMRARIKEAVHEYTVMVGSTRQKSLRSGQLLLSMRSETITPRPSLCKPRRTRVERFHKSSLANC